VNQCVWVASRIPEIRSTSGRPAQAWVIVRVASALSRIRSGPTNTPGNCSASASVSSGTVIPAAPGAAARWVRLVTITPIPGSFGSSGAI
jgi:hypothetical protein